MKKIYVIGLLKSDAACYLAFDDEYLAIQQFDRFVELYTNDKRYETVSFEVNQVGKEAVFENGEETVYVHFAKTELNKISWGIV